VVIASISPLGKSRKAAQLLVKYEKTFLTQRVCLVSINNPVNHQLIQLQSWTVTSRGLGRGNWAWIQNFGEFQMLIHGVKIEKHLACGKK